MKGNLNKKDIVLVSLFGVFVLFGLYFAWAYFVNEKSEYRKKQFNGMQAGLNAVGQIEKRMKEAFKTEPYGGLTDFNGNLLTTEKDLGSIMKDTSVNKILEDRIGYNIYDDNKKNSIHNVGEYVG